MENKKNYQKELEKIIASLSEPKKVLLHSCCAPCSSYCMEYLRRYFHVTVFYYNPNIMDAEEYRKRVEEQKRLIDAYNVYGADNTHAVNCVDAAANTIIQGTVCIQNIYPIGFVEGSYEVERYLEAVKGMETCKEGGSRCETCFALRLQKTAETAKAMGMDYFTTTLTISPLKNAARINQIGQRIAEQTGIAFLPSDFKKNNGYLRSIELSKEYDLYRQDYCGCDFSKRQPVLGKNE